MTDNIPDVVGRYRWVKAEGTDTRNKPFEGALDEVLREIRELLLSKNASYGNSALDPVRVFSRANASEQIRVRIDDKISRLMRGQGFGDEDTVMDLLGYLILLRITEKE